MPRKSSCRKFQITINNPTVHGYSHERIRSILYSGAELLYWCMCDETGEQGTPHTHVFLVFRNSVMFETLQKRFYGAHIEPANGSPQDNRDYIRKEGKWLEEAKHETNHPETFEEWGKLPQDRPAKETQAEQIMSMIQEGKTNAEILEAIPAAYSKLNYIEQARQTLLEARYKDSPREVHVTYLWGDTGTGKTRGVMEKYGYSNVYQVTDYAHPFDNYKGQKVIIFEEFRSSLKIEDMLKYLDIYPLQLPCRYANKVACYTEVYILTNIPLDKQYTHVQQDSPKTWAAFQRRIHEVEFKGNPFPILEDDSFDPEAIFGKG